MKKTIGILILFLSLTAVTIANPVNNGFLGTWTYAVTDTPDGAYKGELTITKEGDTYKGSMAGEGGSIDLQNLKIEGNKLTFKVYVNDYNCYATLTRDGKKLSGKVEVEGESFPFAGEKK